MKERPMIFSGPMVRAILDGKKTQTRRVVKPRQTTPKTPPLTMEPWIVDGEQQTYDDGIPLWIGTHPDYPTVDKWFACDYGQPGDRLWVREMWAVYGEFKDGTGYCYRADGDKSGVRWRSPIYMPRALSRITLEITDVRVERVQGLSEADARAEGVGATVRARLLGVPDEEAVSVDPDPQFQFPALHRNSFATVWNTINGWRPGCAWQDNPWVWVVSFKRVQA
jgi:hypothetical protein